MIVCAATYRPVRNPDALRTIRVRTNYFQDHILNETKVGSSNSLNTRSLEHTLALHATHHSTEINKLYDFQMIHSNMSEEGLGSWTQLGGSDESVVSQEPDYDAIDPALKDISIEGASQASTQAGSASQGPGEPNAMRTGMPSVESDNDSSFGRNRGSLSNSAPPFQAKHYTSDSEALDNDVYLAESVVSTRKRKGRLEYLVKFVGYDEPEWAKDVGAELKADYRTRNPPKRKRRNIG